MNGKGAPVPVSWTEKSSWGVRLTFVRMSNIERKECAANFSGSNAAFWSMSVAATAAVHSRTDAERM